MTTETVEGGVNSASRAIAASSQGLDHQLTQHVTAHVIRLQQGYLADRPGAVASLARLRRAVSAEPGDDPAVWFDIFDGFPQRLLGHGDTASAAERAAHAAVTIFAVHQQSRMEPMHRHGVSLGTAVRALGRENANEDAVLRRFHALGTASSLSETLHHLRGLVTQLRGAAIGLDYGRLARDLWRLQNPRTAPGVRLEWGRAYYRSQPPKADSVGSRVTPTTQTPGDER